MDQMCGGSGLPCVGVYDNFSKEEVAQTLLDKAGNPDPPHIWSIYPTVTWLEQGGKLHRLLFGFPERQQDSYSKEQWAADSQLLASYIARHLRENGLPEYAYRPAYGEREVEGDAARLVHALWALDEAGRAHSQEEWRAAARRGLRFCLESVRVDDSGKAELVLEGQETDAIADCILLQALSCAGGELGADDRTALLARRVRSLVQADGRISELPDARGIDQDHDYLPGNALYALARYAKETGKRELVDNLEATLSWYSRRFRFCHPWGMVGWHPQAWATVHSITGRPEHAAFVFEICDWALPWQHEKSGSFLCELEEDGFSFHTGFIAEAIAEAARLADRVGDIQRRDRYHQSVSEALRFMNNLIIRDEDTYCLAEPELARGGVRQALYLSEVRIDFVSHTLLAFLKAQHLTF
jgi:hypothetical protein